MPSTSGRLLDALDGVGDLTINGVTGAANLIIDSGVLPGNRITGYLSKNAIEMTTKAVVRGVIGVVKGTSRGVAGAVGDTAEEVGDTVKKAGASLRT